MKAQRGRGNAEELRKRPQRNQRMMDVGEGMRRGIGVGKQKAWTLQYVSIFIQ